jgi:hypothetical protein
LNIVGCCSSMEEKKSLAFPASAFGAVGGTLVEAAGCAFAVDEEFLSEVVAGGYTT